MGSINNDMDRKRYSLVDLNSWYSITTDYLFSVADIVVLNTTIESIETPYIFRRSPAFCYIEPMRDYGMKYSVALEFLELINILKSDYGHLKVSPTELGRRYVNHSKHTSPSSSNLGPGYSNQATSYF